MSRQDFLVEIGTEELPPKSLPLLSEAFESGIVAGLKNAGIRHGAVTRFAAPRRLAVQIEKVADRQPDQAIQRKGPPVSASFTADGMPTRAATAFADSCNTTVAALERISEPKGEFLYYTGVKAGAPTTQLLTEIVQEALARLPIAKRMRWGSGTAEFVRPVHWIVMLYGRDVVPARMMDIDTGRASRGHRFMAPRDIVLTSAKRYATALASKGFVIVDFSARREHIRHGVRALAEAHDGDAVISEALLNEVTALVEWPVPLIGRFEERFLALPPEVLIATLQDHQRYFPVRGRDGQLSAWFVTVSNIESRDPAEVRAGNERVVRPRLADAAFFWEQDCRQSLQSRRDRLKTMTFQAQLGSYFAKSERVKALARRLAPLVGADAEAAERAAELAKCDLLTGLVGEFPELQGTMGTYYARHDGEAAAVADALAEQYLPRFAGDALPHTPTGLALALADKLDTIAGIFAIGQKPSGTKDPYALRRLALGVLRIVLERAIDLDLPSMIHAALDLIDTDLTALRHAQAATGKPASTLPSRGAVETEVYDYMLERLRAYLLESEGDITTEMFDAVLDRRPASPVDFALRLRALAEFVSQPSAIALAAANKRIANILKKADSAVPITLVPALLESHEEQALAADLQRITPLVAAHADRRDYAAALRAGAELKASIDAFFDKVMVMAEDPAVRANRLCLLASLRALFLTVADLSRLPG